MLHRLPSSLKQFLRRRLQRPTELLLALSAGAVRRGLVLPEDAEAIFATARIPHPEAFIRDADS
jgi:hypothetical protein